ncbi:MAG: hypothetical protein SF187_15310 [Deltaproteobacteria bacterium]|nr:hypothetical protein [Deltaproteobacteria bacterium]
MRSANLKTAWSRLAILPLLALLGACTQGRSYIVVALRAFSDPIPGVAQVRLQLTASGMTDDLTYGSKPGPMLELTQLTDTTLSVSFSDAFVGKAMLSATALDVSGNVLGYGENPNVQIAAGRIAYATVLVTKGAKPPVQNDGGVSDGGSSDAGADASLMMCTVGDVNACGANGTCGLSCLGDKPTSKCVAAGTKQPGELCTGPGECAPGSQCAQENCGPKVCQKLCRTNADCANGATCFREQVCGNNVPSGVRTCSQPCDPRGEAKAGCAEGLRCIVFSQEVADCACVVSTQFGGEGATCQTTGDCQPGTFCVMTGGALACRPICKLTEPATCGPGRTCEKLTNPVYNTYGACLPAI